MISCSITSDHGSALGESRVQPCANHSSESIISHDASMIEQCFYTFSARDCLNFWQSSMCWYTLHEELHLWAEGFLSRNSLVMAIHTWTELGGKNTVQCLMNTRGNGSLQDLSWNRASWKRERERERGGGGGGVPTFRRQREEPKKERKKAMGWV